MNHDKEIVRGGSNTPCLNAFTEKRVLEKRVLIDFLSVTFDFVVIQATKGKTYRVSPNDFNFVKLLSLLGYDGEIYDIQKIQPIRGYSHCYLLGEHIKLLFGGEHTKTSSGKYSMNLLMSGQACREFENIVNGNWNSLISYLLDMNSVIKRIDIAIDDFDGSEIDIYDIEDHLRKRNFVSPFRKINYQFTEAYYGEQVLSEGFTITLGSPGSNQLQIYDKRLERDAKDQPDLDTDVWYRYEMRFVDEKAESVSKLYLSSVEQNNSKEFMKYARELLKGCLDLKTPKATSKQRSRWDTLPEWEMFLDSVEKIDLNVKHRIDTTIQRRKRWYDRSLKKVNAAFYGSFDSEQENFIYYIAKNVLEGFKSFEDKDLSMINNYRILSGLNPLTWQDINKYRQELGKLTGEENE